MVVETKCSDAQDPFPKPSPKPEPDVNESQPSVKKQKPVAKRSVQQLAKNARNILLAHGALAAFVIGIYGHTVRLARFDRTCALVSVPFRLDSNKGAMRLHEFFWRFTHPLVCKTFAGCDPTVIALDDSSKEWIKQELRKARALHWQKRTANISEGRRIEVYDERSRACTPYLLYDMVSVSRGLFSRATTVWRAIEDTRIWKDGRLVPDPSRTVPVKCQIVKEAWRRLDTRSESEFYRRLNDTIPREEQYGLASMVCGGDLGEIEMRRWKATKQRQEGSSNNMDGTQDQASDIARFPEDSPSKRDTMLPYPQHQTYSRRMALGVEFWYLERSHVRIVTDDVGRPLSNFNSTFELVRAIRDAIRGTF